MRANDQFSRERKEIGDAIDRTQRLFAIGMFEGLRHDLTEGYARESGATLAVLEAIDDAIDNIQPMT